MKYLPFENITYRSKLDADVIIEKLKKEIEPRKTFRMTGVFGNSNHKPYEGSIEGKTFNISRIIRYQNSFLPKIKGDVNKDINGTRINVKMRLHLFVIIFMFIWFGGVGFGCFTVLSIAFIKKSFDAIYLLPFGMLLFGYLLVTLGFKYESIKSKKYLSQLFEAEMEE